MKYISYGDSIDNIEWDNDIEKWVLRIDPDELPMKEMED